MELNMTRLGKYLLPVAAASMSAFGLAGVGTAHSTNDSMRDHPVDCEIAVTKGRHGHTYEGRVHAVRTVKGTYELNISKRGRSGNAMISQSGEFYVAAGKTETLGQATFGGLPPNAVNAELTLSWNGRTLSCSNQADL